MTAKGWAEGVSLVGGAWWLFVLPGMLIATIWGALDYRWPITGVIVGGVLLVYSIGCDKVAEREAKKQ